MTAPLDGVAVLELTSWMAAPSAGAILADLGADVIKIEPPRGDPMRTISRQPKLAEDSPLRGIDPSFQVDNRGKRSIAVAVDQPAGADLVRRLAATRQVFLTNLLPHRQERYGLDPDGLFAVNPRIVHATLTGYGREGPEAWRPGYDVTAFFGRGAVTDSSLEPGGVPPFPRPAQGDHTTGLALVVAILAGLRLVEQTGAGQVVDTSLLETAAWTMATDLSATLLDRRPVPKRDRHHLISPLANRFCCADDRWIILNMPEVHWWAKVCDVLERPEWVSDERFSTAQGPLRQHAGGDRPPRRGVRHPYRRRSGGACSTTPASSGVRRRPSTSWSTIPRPAPPGVFLADPRVRRASQLRDRRRPGEHQRHRRRPPRSGAGGGRAHPVGAGRGRARRRRDRRAHRRGGAGG